MGAVGHFGKLEFLLYFLVYSALLGRVSVMLSLDVHTRSPSFAKVFSLKERGHVPHTSFASCFYTPKATLIKSKGEQNSLGIFVSLEASGNENEKTERS